MAPANGRAMIRSLMAALVLLPLLACVNEPVATTPSTNGEVPVDELFTHDGCTVFRFRDGTYHYYVRCRGEPTATTLSCTGKNCGKDDSIPTFSSAAR
jgi:hypothetical protein